MMTLKDEHLGLLLRMSREVGPAAPLLPIALSSAVDDARRGADRFEQECDRLLTEAPKCDYVARVLSHACPERAHRVAYQITGHADVMRALREEDPVAAVLVTPQNAVVVLDEISAPDSMRSLNERDGIAMSIAVLRRLFYLTGRLEFAVHAVLLWTGVDGLIPVLSEMEAPDKYTPSEKK